MRIRLPERYATSAVIALTARRIIDENVQRSERVDRLPHCADAVPPLGDVRIDREAVAARRFHFMDDTSEFRVDCISRLIHGGRRRDHGTRACARVRDRHLPSQPATSAGDQGDLVVQRERLHLSSTLLTSIFRLSAQA